ncbi:hypothetical protein EVAR_40755_1 [Eumeta japonica]|uniref:Uncharacterized protein n=1 Tax=Eumeta variegata TaxID=151549 RepID=A0A4C1X7B4_EUMVA|nr:hypothetical protein EVAR_40755_1 [Eumeta japonica]
MLATLLLWLRPSGQFSSGTKWYVLASFLIRRKNKLVAQFVQCRHPNRVPLGLEIELGLKWDTGFTSLKSDIRKKSSLKDPAREVGTQMITVGVRGLHTSQHVYHRNRARELESR